MLPIGRQIILFNLGGVFFNTTSNTKSGRASSSKCSGKLLSLLTKFIIGTISGDPDYTSLFKY